MGWLIEMTLLFVAIHYIVRGIDFCVTRHRNNKEIRRLELVASQNRKQRQQKQESKV